MLNVLREQVKQWKQPIVGTFTHGEHALFKILVSTILSLRTKDLTTEAASHRLFEKAVTPKELLKLSEAEIAKIIYPVGFYKTKAKNLRKVCEILIREYNGRVPDEMEGLLKLPGVGRKTANLVLTVGYGKPGICVDIHVHRISNRWGLVKTKTPDETEQVLREVLPQKHWIEFNDILVCFGQNLCVPVSPKCSTCLIQADCPRIGVKTHR